MLTFRITTDNDESLKKIFQDKKVLISKEDKDSDESNCSGLHYHGILYEDVVRQTLRNWILSSFPEAYIYDSLTLPDGSVVTKKKTQGNKFHSISYTDDSKGGVEGFERYVCKGTATAEPLIILNTQEVDTKARYDEYWRVNQSLTRKVKKEKSKSLKEMFREYIFTKYISNDGSRRRITLMDLVEEYRLFCLENDCDPTPRSSGETMFLQILSKLNNDESERERWFMYYGRTLELISSI